MSVINAYAGSAAIVASESADRLGYADDRIGVPIDETGHRRCRQAVDDPPGDNIGRAGQIAAKSRPVSGPRLVGMQQAGASVGQPVDDMTAGRQKVDARYPDEFIVEAANRSADNRLLDAAAGQFVDEQDQLPLAPAHRSPGIACMQDFKRSGAMVDLVFPHETSCRLFFLPECCELKFADLAG